LIFEGRKGAAISWKKSIARYYEKGKFFDVFEASKYRKTGSYSKVYDEYEQLTDSLEKNKKYQLQSQVRVIYLKAKLDMWF
jgi:hypothetical protein